VQAELVECVDAGQRRELETELADLRRSQQELREEIRRTAPRLASWSTPPRSTPSPRRLLDGDTAVLAYSVGEARTWLFVFAPDGTLHQAPLDAGADV